MSYMKRDNATDREIAYFEAGIKLGALYHQFLGLPIDPNFIEEFEDIIERSIGSRPYIKDISVKLNREIIREEINKSGYAEVNGKMLDIVLKIRYKSEEVVVALKYDEDSGYPSLAIG